MANTIAANNNVKFLLGLSTSLPETGAQQGAFYLTTDENRLYIGNGDTPVLLNEQVKFVDTSNDLPTTGTPEEIVFVRKENILCGWDSTNSKYVQINPDTYVNNMTSNVGSVTDGASTISIGVEQKGGTAQSKSASFTIKAGAGVGLTASGNTLTIASTGSGGTEVSIAATQAASDNTTAKITQTVKYKDASGSYVGDTENDTISIKAGANMESAVVSGSEGSEVITLNAKEQGVTALSATNATSGFSIGLTQSASGTGYGQKTATIDPAIKIDNNGTEETVKFASGTADLKKLASKDYVAAEILKHEKAIDALQFKGIITSDSDLPVITGGAVKVGYVYKVGAVTDKVKAIDANAKVGDLIITTEGTGYAEDANGFITAGGKYELIPSGDELTYSMTANDTNWALTGSDNKAYGTLKFANGTDITVTGAASNDSHDQTITVAHATKTVNKTSGTAVTTTAGNTTDVTVVTGVTEDATGHIKSVETTKVSIKDTTVTNVAVGVAKDTSAQKVTTTTTITSTDNAQKSASSSISSETLTFAVTGTDTAINMVWGSF